ncbi:MAG: dTDP-4-dehydrorhamnose reductase [Methylovirgula sp.]
MLRIGVTGRTGQLVHSLVERGPMRSVDVVTLARPDCDLLDADSIARTVEAAACDVIVNTAAYTAVDRAESEPDLAMEINAEGARRVARAAKVAGIPIIQISTDYVFDGQAAQPYREDDATAPLCAYGRSKLAGERAVAEACADHVILRAAWVYSATAQNFVRTMLRLGETRASIGVIADQFGSPTYAPDLADVILAAAAKLVAKPDAPELRGIFHAPGGGEASWADFAEAVFAGAARRGRAPVRVDRITTQDYPTPAQRPKNSRLDPQKLHSTYGLRLPDWRPSLEACLDRLVAPLQERALEERALKERK